MGNKAALELNKVTKKYKRTDVISKMNLKVRNGEFLVLLGPSGCGKSTTLRMMAGLEKPSDGQILIDGKDAQKMTSYERNIAMVFQDYALYPNMTVYQNLEYALKVHKVRKNEREHRLKKIIATLDLAAYRDRLPGQLSGGQKQRVALGRGMAKKSRIFLLDEPLSNIDVQLREKARDEIQNLHEKNQQTIVYVTHDQLEAMALGDRIAIINEGKIQMIDTPDNIYNHPANLFVAKFVGTPQINILEIAYRKEQIYLKDKLLPFSVECLKKAALSDGKLHLGIRPEHVSVKREKRNATGLELPVKVEQVIDYGRYQQLLLNIGEEQNIKAITTNNEFKNGDLAYASFSEERILFFEYTSGINIES